MLAIALSLIYLLVQMQATVAFLWARNNTGHPCDAKNYYGLQVCAHNRAVAITYTDAPAGHRFSHLQPHN